MWLRNFIKFPTFVFMNQVKPSIQGYFLAFLGFIGCASLFCFLFTRQQQMELVNLHHSVVFDYFFLGITNTAEVVFPIAFLLILIFKYKSLLKPYLISYACSTLVVQLLKHIVFANCVRPILYLKSSGIQWHLVEGLAINELNSFPSGHTNAAWWMYFWMAYFSSSRYLGFMFGILAFLVAYSRVYLFQHFPIDTLFGAVFGFSASFITYYFLVLKKKSNA